MREVAGCFHCIRVVRGLPRAVRKWRVTTNDQDIAAEVSATLGGKPTGSSDAGGWEILTDAVTVRVVVEGARENCLTFRLIDNYGIGVFEFRSDPWSLREAFGEYVGTLPECRNDLVCELGIGATLVTTELRMHVEFTRPSLRVLK